MQRMVFEEMLPAHFGKQLENFDNGSLLNLRNLSRDDITSGPRIYNEFTTAAFRFITLFYIKFILYNYFKKCLNNLKERLTQEYQNSS